MEPGRPRGDGDPGHDRQFGELLQELRVAQTGVQILFAFLLALVGAVQLAASFVIGAWATLLAASLAGLFVLLWFVIPLVHRIRRRPVGGDSA